MVGLTLIVKSSCTLKLRSDHYQRSFLCIFKLRKDFLFFKVPGKVTKKKKKAYQLCSFFVPRCKKNSFYFYIFVHDHNPFHEIQEHSPQNGICVVQRPQRLIFGLSSDPLHCLLLCIQLIFCVHRRKTVLKLKV